MNTSYVPRDKDYNYGENKKKKRISMKRFMDKSFTTYSAYNATKQEIYVKCPKCSGLGFVTADQDMAYFKCTNCGSVSAKDCTIYHYEAHNHCKSCGRYYKQEITEKKKQYFRVLNVACPFCGYVMAGEVYKTARAFYYYDEIRNAREPFFEYELWYTAYFKDRPVWAINREHLSYLINYLEADLREKPGELQNTKTQADRLPAFMQTAKNREPIVKLLKKLQKKQSELV